MDQCTNKYNLISQNLPYFRKHIRSLYLIWMKEMGFLYSICNLSLQSEILVEEDLMEEIETISVELRTSDKKSFDFHKIICTSLLVLSSHLFGEFLLLHLFDIINHQNNSKSQFMTYRTPQAVVYQKEESHKPHCCFTLFTQRDHTEGEERRTLKVQSEPKRDRCKKIDLTILRRGFSQSKVTQQTQASNSREKLIAHPRLQYKVIEIPKGVPSVASKLSTQRTSFKNSRVTFNHDLKIERTNQHLFNPNTNTQHYFKHQAPAPTQNTQENMSNLPFLSEISIVEQQFISYQSANLNLFNFLTNLNSNDSKLAEPTFNPNPNRGLTPTTSWANKLGEQRQCKNPLERIMDRKKGEKKTEGRKRLVL